MANLENGEDPDD
jgi:hypothetical protein